MKEAFKIAEENTKKRRSTDKRQRDLKATFELLEVAARVLVRKLTKIHFGKKKDISTKRKMKMD